MEGGAREQAVVGSFIRALLRSPLGRERAALWVKDGKPARIRFEELAGSWLEGRRVAGTSGLTDAPARSVTLNVLFLRHPNEIDGAVILAHELFGHVAGEDGAGLVYREYAADNETYASLLGWIVALELGAKIELREARLFAQDRGAYLEALWRRNDWTTTLLSAEQLLDPYPELQRRRDLLPRREDSKLARALEVFERPGNAAELRRDFSKEARSEFMTGRRAGVESLAARYAALLER